MRNRIHAVWTAIKGFRPEKPLLKRLGIGAGMVILAGAAFFLGLHFHGAGTEAQASPPEAVLHDHHRASMISPDQRIVGYVYGNMPISREELGEYLIQRFGAERLEFLVNRRIVEHACKARGIYVTDQEIQVQLYEDLKKFGNITLKEFETSVLRRFNKTMYEWTEDVIRPKLLLAKLVRPMITVTEEDLVKAFEARYGDKVECRMIVLPPKDRHNADIHAKVKNSEAAFDEEARKQGLVPHLAAQAGKVPPIHRHFGDRKIEDEVFLLKDGQVSKLMEMPDGSVIILKRDKLIPADTKKRLEDVRLQLHEEVFEFKLAQEIPNVFKRLRDEANPVLYLRPHQQQQIRQEDLERVTKQILNPGAPSPSGPTGPVAAPPPSMPAVPPVPAPGALTPLPQPPQTSP